MEKAEGDAGGGSTGVSAAPRRRRSRLLGWLQLPLFQPRTVSAPPPPPSGESRRPGIRLPRVLAGNGADGAARALAARLAARLRTPLAELVLTDNRTILLSSSRTEDGALRLRLHRAFLEADDTALAAVVAFAGGCRGQRRSQALGRLRAHVDAWRGVQRVRGAVAASHTGLRPRGAVHDLLEIRDRLNEELFAGRLTPAITWGRWANLTRRRRTIRLGSYDQAHGLIRIHPALDQPWVPREFVAAVVHHEMLHALLPARESGGRRCLHGPDFRSRERELPGYAAAEAWLAANLHRLLRSRPRR